MENGCITLLGATTENPSFSLNSALLSRCRVIVLTKLSQQAVECVLQRALTDCECGIANVLKRHRVRVPPAVATLLAACADGDARVALNALEMAVNACVAGDVYSQSTAVSSNNSNYSNNSNNSNNNSNSKNSNDASGT